MVERVEYILRKKDVQATRLDKHCFIKGTTCTKNKSEYILRVNSLPNVDLFDRLTMRRSFFPLQGGS